MHRCLYFFLSFFFITNTVSAQEDFLQLKKRNRTVETFFKGSYITFQTDGYQWLTGRIFKVRNDSVFLYQIDVQMRPNAWGLGIVADTTVTGLVGFSIKNIRAIPNDHQAYITRIGSILQIAAGGYAALNLINAGLNKEPLFDDRNKKRLGFAAAAFLLGWGLHRTDPDTYVLGKKYKLTYVKLTP